MHSAGQLDDLGRCEAMGELLDIVINEFRKFGMRFVVNAHA
jgi:hypothetical protein